MRRWTIEPMRRYAVVVAGPLDAARTAAGEHGIQRPFRDVSVNGYGAVHAVVSAEPEQMRAWWAAGHERIIDAESGPNGRPVPGALCFYLPRAS